MKRFVLCLVFILVLFSFCLIAKTEELNLIGYNIIIDPGHGGKDMGTSYMDYYEKDIALNISFALEQELIKQGSNVTLTRYGDYDLSYPEADYRKKSDFDNRIKLINEVNNNIYLSIHLNYINSSLYSGAQVFYLKDDEKSKKLALSIQTIFNNEGLSTREIKVIPSGLYMYSKLNKTGVLIECGFLSNPSERARLNTTSYQKKLATVITKGIIEYYNLS